MNGQYILDEMQLAFYNYIFYAMVRTQNTTKVTIVDVSRRYLFCNHYYYHNTVMSYGLRNFTPLCSISFTIDKVIFLIG